ncbi:MAG TPA: hypothetical protein VKH44_02210, partial [Pirellulaceae bacterium]|nr:hypothetical protein [Pirellulaceae bacterium]
MDFAEGEGGVEGFGEHLLLMVVGAGRVGGDEVLELLFSVGAEEVAEKEEAAGFGDANGFVENVDGLGDVVDDTVGHDDVEHR